MTTDSIRRVLNDYFAATHAGDANRVRAAFTPEARIHGTLDGSPVNWSVTDLVERIALRPTASERGDTYAKRVVFVERHASLAVALTEVLVRGEPMVDAIVLLRDEAGRWRIANKTFEPVAAPATRSTTARRNDVEVRVIRRSLTPPERHIEVFAGEQLVAFTHQLARLDASAALPSPSSAHIAAIATFTRVAPDLLDGLELQWIEPHNEGPFRGMKVKTRQADGRYAWVVVGANGEPITFERDVVWSNGMGRRVTEQLLV